MNIIIAGAWPYANGSLHIGHMAALLPGDVIARYYRAKGDTVCYVSGSDCHGTPVTIRARQENKTPEEISDLYHEEFVECFSKLGFSYDLYGKTSSPEHKQFVIDFHRRLYEGGLVYESTTQQAFCESCNQSLPDRYVTGTCPHCGKPARGDQCEACGSVLEPENLLEAKCHICGNPPVFRPSTHLFLAITKLKEALNLYVESHTDWRRNALELSRRYIDEGLRDRAITRDLDWGINVPKEGYEDKKIYIWAENVLGYLSGCHTLCERQGLDFNGLWNSSRQYYIHGKDNIPFHTIILPALLLARKDVEFHLPDEIISSEYLTLEGRKISTSGNWAIWAKDITAGYNADSIRYFLIANGPEKRDTDFSWREFVNSHNGEILGAYGNFVNRSLVFIQKYFNGQIPDAECDTTIKLNLAELFPHTGRLVENGSLKEALETIFSFIRSANKYFDEEQPWISIRENQEKCGKTLATCTLIIANLSVLLKPFLPFSSKKIQDMLGIDIDQWAYFELPEGKEITAVRILFERLDKKIIAQEENRLKNGG
jgi:methionyl-tRNA synthetase